MDIRNRHGLKLAAADALACAPNQKKLVLLWAGVSSALPLLASVISFVLDHQIAGTGGLSGIGLRSVLTTVQSLLSLATSTLLPFWSLGYTATILRLSRKGSVGYPTLLEGFRRFGPALRLMLLEILIYGAICFACVQIGGTVLSFTPLAAPVYQILNDSQEMLLSGIIDESTLQAVTDAMIPILFICGALCVIVMIPVTYRLRLADLYIMDTNRCGALQAIRESIRLMRRNSLALFRLDLSFWWFYLFQVLLSILSYGDVLLPMLGIELPFGGDTAFFVFYIAALLAQLLLLYFFSNKVQTTYALFYNTLRTPPEVQKAPVD